MRIGTGYDVHRLTENRKLVLGGVEIPYEKGLLGHSDADVLLHAVMDALLGAAALGDIGQLFPDRDPAYEGISSLVLLAEVAKTLGAHGFRVVNIDATVICQRPKLAPYRARMAENIASVLGIRVSQVSVKATTEEGLGFTGAGEGIACQAVCLVEETGDARPEEAPDLKVMEQNGGKMKLYNSLTQRIEDFRENVPGKVSMYTCGPTVYHYAHIGNLRSYICEDVLEKTLRYLGYDVKRVMNITDVGHLSSDADTGEDKMLAGAKREHKTVMEIAKFYTDAFFEDCVKLNIKRPDVVEPATNCIDAFIHMIEVLLEKGYAYRAGENIYFDTSKLSSYYVFGKQNEEELMVGVRDDVTEDTNKKNRNDFVLWFTKSKFEDQALKWDSPWGVGYPGWHIECSCISMKHLGEYIDIHCGGVDNIFPHHTNEIAQSESYLGHKWCNYWFHVHHLNDRSGKMSKSKGNILTVSVLQEQGFDPLAYRFFCLQSHYRKPLEFSFDALSNAQGAYLKLKKRALNVKAAADRSGEAPDQEAFVSWKARFEDALSDDINTAMALTAVYDVLKADVNDATKAALIGSFDEVLGLDLLKAPEEAAAGTEEDAALASWVEERIALRKAAKKEKDFAEADRIRQELLDRGIVIRDTREGTLWEKA